MLKVRVTCELQPCHVPLLSQLIANTSRSLAMWKLAECAKGTDSARIPFCPNSEELLI